METLFYNELIKFAEEKQKQIGVSITLHSPFEFVNQAFINSIGKVNVNYKATIYGLIFTTKKKLSQHFSLATHERTCTKCGEVKWSFQFYIKKDHGGLMEDVWSFYTHCEECQKAINKVARDKVQADEVLKADKKEYFKKYYAENKAKLKNIQKLRAKTPDAQLNRIKWLEENKGLQNEKRRNKQTLERENLSDTYLKSLLSQSLKMTKSDIRDWMIIDKRQELMQLRKPNVL